MDGFHWFFIEKPFEDVVPWFAAAFYNRASRIEFVDAPGFLAEFETYEQYTTRVRTSGEKAIVFPFEFRLLEVSFGDAFCMIESNVDANSDVWTEIIVKGCQAPLYRFEATYDSDGFALGYLHVTDWSQRNRHVLINRSENNSSRWKFQQDGKPEPWEDLLRYEARRIRNRLPPDLLVDYAFKAFGVDMNRLLTRNFSRSANIVEAPHGEPLDQFKPYFDDILTRCVDP